MRVFVCSSIEAGSHKAHAINVVKTAEGFAQLGHDVTVVWRSPANGAITERELNRQYGVSRPVRHRQIPWRFAGFDLGPNYRFGRAATLVCRFGRADFVYCRDFMTPVHAVRMGLPTVVESHAHPDSRSIALDRLIEIAKHPKLLGLVTIGEPLVEHFAERGFPREKIRIVPDGVDLSLFERPAKLPPSPLEGAGPHVVYAGHLYDYKGIPTILDAAALRPAFNFHLVGGTEEDIARHRVAITERGLQNVTLHGWIDHPAVAPYLWHADALLLPPSANHPSAAWTSPVKLGEYLASGSPVIASHIPALRYWLSGDTARFFAADDATELSNAIREVINGGRQEQDRCRSRFKLAHIYSYENRARSIIEASRPTKSIVYRSLGLSLGSQQNTYGAMQ